MEGDRGKRLGWSGRVSIDYNNTASQNGLKACIRIRPYDFTRACARGIKDGSPKSYILCLISRTRLYPTDNKEQNCMRSNVQLVNNFRMAGSGWKAPPGERDDNVYFKQPPLSQIRGFHRLAKDPQFAETCSLNECSNYSCSLCAHKSRNIPSSWRERFGGKIRRQFGARHFTKFCVWQKQSFLVNRLKKKNKLKIVGILQKNYQKRKLRTVRIVQKILTYSRWAEHLIQLLAGKNDQTIARNISSLQFVWQIAGSKDRNETSMHRFDVASGASIQRQPFFKHRHSSISILKQLFAPRKILFFPLLSLYILE